MGLHERPPQYESAKQKKHDDDDAFGDIRTMIDKYRKERELQKDRKTQYQVKTTPTAFSGSQRIFNAFSMGRGNDQRRGS